MVNGNTSDLGPAVWLTLHTSFATPAQLAAFDAEVAGARDAGLRLLCLCITPDDYSKGQAGPAPWFSAQRPLDAQTRMILDRALSVHPGALFLIRFYAQLPHLPSDASVVLANSSAAGSPRGTERPDLVMNSPTRAWAAAAAGNMSVMLRYLDGQYPGRIAGAFPCFLHTSEWFFPGPGDAIPPLGARSTRPKGGGAGGGADGGAGAAPAPAARDTVASTLFSDYSQGMRSQFCNDTGRGGAGAAAAACTLPTPVQRGSLTPGVAFASKEAAAMNAFLSTVVVDAIEALGAEVKRVSGGKALMVAFYGYLFALADSRLTSSGHLALSRLLASPHVDGVASPYQYLKQARDPRGMFNAHGPMDAASAAGKVWVVEDDTRTSLVAPGTHLRYCNTTADTTNILRRNVYSSAMHGAAAYFYDLGSAGWFGRPDMAAATAALWGNVSVATRNVLRMPSAVAVAPAAPVAPVASDAFGAGLPRERAVAAAPPLRLAPDVAVFVDDASMAALTLDPTRTPFNMLMMKYLPFAVGTVGASVRFLLLSDLLRPPPHALDLSSVRLAVMANALAMGPELREAVATRLATDNRTVVWVYAPGALAGLDPATLNVTRMQEVTGLPLAMGGAQSPLATTLTAGVRGVDRRGRTARGASKRARTVGAAPPRWGPDVAGAGFGETQLAMDPWFYVQPVQTNRGNDNSSSSTSIRGGGAPPTALGHYATGPGAGLVSVAWRDAGSYRSMFVGSPGLPAAAWRDVMDAAGVHLYRGRGPAAVGSVVEARGRALLVHAGGIPLPPTEHPAVVARAGGIGRGVECGGLQRAQCGGVGAAPTARLVTLPGAASSVVDAETGAALCAASPCTTFRTPPMAPGDVLLAWVS